MSTGMTLRNTSAAWQNAHPCEVLSNSGHAGDGGVFWWACCSDSGPAGQRSAPPASLLSSTASWFRICHWMSVLTSELPSQPCARVSGLGRNGEREGDIVKKRSGMIISLFIHHILDKFFIKKHMRNKINFKCLIIRDCCWPTGSFAKQISGRSWISTEFIQCYAVWQITKF